MHSHNEHACVAPVWDLEVRSSSLARRIVSLDRESYFSLSLFTRGYKWNRRHTAGGGGGGVTMQWTNIPSGEE